MASKNKIVKIAVTGPESSGKSFTAEYLARVFDGWVVPEFAREYIDHLDRAYNYDDILNIAKAQLDIEKKVTDDAIIEKVEIVFFDSELMNTKIWAEEKYHQCDDFIIQGIIESDYDHYLLMRPDIEWVADDQRENPHDRDRLFNLYIHHFNLYKKSYTVLEGSLDNRLALGVAIVKTFLG
jgi:nicotinamide riboside kinase